jgi:hypothetical protein
MYIIELATYDFALSTIRVLGSVIFSLLCKICRVTCVMVALEYVIIYTIVHSWMTGQYKFLVPSQCHVPIGIFDTACYRVTQK